MYLQTEGVAPIEKERIDKDTWSHLKPIKRRRMMSVPVWAARDDEGDGERAEEEDQELDEEDVSEEEEDEDEEEDDRRDPTDYGHGDENEDDRSSETGLEVIRERGDEGGDAQDGDDPDALEDGPDTGDGAESPRKGKIPGVRYKRRDMYKSLDGTAMLALGELTVILCENE